MTADAGPEGGQQVSTVVGREVPAARLCMQWAWTTSRPPSHLLLLPAPALPRPPADPCPPTLAPKLPELVPTDTIAAAAAAPLLPPGAPAPGTNGRAERASPPAAALPWDALGVLLALLSLPPACSDGAHNKAQALGLVVVQCVGECVHKVADGPTRNKGGSCHLERACCSTCS